VTIDISSSNPDEGTLSSTLLIFSSANWAVAQTVTVTGQSDDYVDGDVEYAVTMSTSTLDTAYSSVSIADVTLTSTDDGMSPCIENFVWASDSGYWNDTSSWNPSNRLPTHADSVTVNGNVNVTVKTSEILRSIILEDATLVFDSDGGVLDFVDSINWDGSSEGNFTDASKWDQARSPDYTDDVDIADGANISLFSEVQIASLDLWDSDIDVLTVDGSIVIDPGCGFTCSPPCGEHANCTGLDECTCHTGWTGYNCSEPTVDGKCRSCCLLFFLSPPSVMFFLSVLCVWVRVTLEVGKTIWFKLLTHDCRLGGRDRQSHQWPRHHRSQRHRDLHHRAGLATL
jgi:hypothetical protein